jgi:hypothetical protein
MRNRDLPVEMYDSLESIDRTWLTRRAFALLLLFAAAVCPPGKFDDGTSCVSCGFAYYCPGGSHNLEGSCSCRSGRKVCIWAQQG